MHEGTGDAPAVSAVLHAGCGYCGWGQGYSRFIGDVPHLCIAAAVAVCAAFEQRGYTPQLPNG